MNPPMHARTAEELEAARLMLSPFTRRDYRLFPLSRGQKKPRDTGWQTSDYSFADIGRWLKQGGNVGIALQACDLVIDVDPRNFAPGDDPLARLSHDVGENLDIAPTVLSGRGDGGRHLYFRKPTVMRIHGKLGAYPGIDFKSKGGLIVGSGSIHPMTGGVYKTDDFTMPITEVKTAPRALLEMLRRPDPTVLAGDRVGKISNERLAELLAVLDPVDYGSGHYDDWIRLAAGCHDASAGGGLVEFLNWCAGDPVYADEVSQDKVIRHWESFEAGRPGGATYRTLFKAVVDADRPDLVAALGDDDDVEDFDTEVIDDPDAGRTLISATEMQDDDDRDSEVEDTAEQDGEVEDRP